MAQRPGNFNILWSDEFDGPAGATENKLSWGRVLHVKNSNNELQDYTDSANNAYLSGNGELYIVPQKQPSGSQTTWTSARLETIGSWSCAAGRAVRFQAEIQLPDFTNDASSPRPRFNGLWPAFWTLGDAIRSSHVGWPKCGEWDIMEVTNKLNNQNQGTLHFLGANGQHNDSFRGRVAYQGGVYHTWAFEVDRRSSDWRQQTLAWYLDGTQYYQVSGAAIGTEQQWQELAWMPYYIILNVAVGGDYPGAPDANTASGLAAAMRVKSVGVYQSN